MLSTQLGRTDFQSVLFPRLLLPALLVWLLSGSLLRGAAPPTRDAFMAKLERILKTDPHYPAALATRAERRRERLDFTGAFDDLQQLFAGKPTGFWADHARGLWLRCVRDFFAHDFDAAARRFARHPRLWSDNLAWLREGALEQKRLPHRRALALYLVLEERRLESSGKPLTAAEALFSLAALDAPGAYIPVKGDPARKLGFSVWMRQRYERLLERATAEQRNRLEAVVARRWRDARSAGDDNALRAAIVLLGVEHSLGREYRLLLAKRLGARGYSPLADQLLQELRRGPDRVSAARATYELAEMLARAGLLQDAVALYRLLDRDFAKVQLHPGQTGADVWNDIVTDKRFLPFVEEPSPLSRFRGRFRVQDKGPTMAPGGFTFTPFGAAPTFFHHARLTLIANALHINDRRAVRERYLLRLKGSAFSDIGEVANLDQRVHYGYQTLGHVAILNLGAWVVAVDPVSGKVLWQHEILRLPRPTPTRDLVYVEDGGARVDYYAAGMVRLGEPLPLTPTRLCLATKQGLMALEPVTGRVMWSRKDVPLYCRLFQDANHVFVVRLAPGVATMKQRLADDRMPPDIVRDWPLPGGPYLVAPDKPTATAAYRLQDGAPVPIKDFSALLKKRIGAVDGRLLLWEADPKSPALRLYDAAMGKDVWRRSFEPGAIPLRSIDPALTGAVEPTGDVFIIESRTKKPVLSAKLVDPEHIKNAKAIRLVGDKEYFYLASQGPLDKETLSVPRSLFLARAGLRAIPVNGWLYALSRKTGRVCWCNPARNQSLLISEIDRLPVVVLASAWEGPFVIGTRWIADRLHERVVVFAKHTGKLVFERDFRGDIGNGSFIHTVEVNPQTGAMTLSGTRFTVILTLVPKDR
jgi:hypothetical protein